MWMRMKAAKPVSKEILAAMFPVFQACFVTFDPSPKSTPTKLSSSSPSKPMPALTSLVETVHVDPDGLLSAFKNGSFTSLLKEYQVVFDPHIPGYSGAASPVQRIVNMGPVEPPSIFS